MLQALPEARLHQIAQLGHQRICHCVGEPHPFPLVPHQTGTLQLPQLAADMGLTEAGGLDQGCHIHGPLVLQLAQQLQPGRLTQQPEELAELIEKFRGGGGARCGVAHQKPLCR